MQITIKDEHAKSYLNYLGNLKQTKIEARKALDSEISDLDEQMHQLIVQINGSSRNSPVTQLTIMPSGYSRDFTWGQKAEYVLKILKRRSTTAEVVDQLLLLEPTMPRKKAIGSISATLTVKAREVKSLFDSDTNERGEFVYGLKEWNNTAIAA